MSKSTLRDSVFAICPPWLATGVAEKVMYLCALTLDGFIESLNQGLLARMPGQGTSTALPYIGADRVIDRGYAESDSSFVNRLISALDTWRGAGTPATVLNQILGYISPYTPTVRTVAGKASVWDSIVSGVWSRLYATTNNWNWDGQDERKWCNGFVIIEATGSPWTAPPVIGSGPVIGASTGSIGSTATPAQVADIRRLVGKWKRQDIAVKAIILNFSPGFFVPTLAAGDSSLPDGKFGSWGKVDGSDHEVPARFSTAAYWDGVT